MADLPKIVIEIRDSTYEAVYKHGVGYLQIFVPMLMSRLRQHFDIYGEISDIQYFGFTSLPHFFIYIYDEMVTSALLLNKWDQLTIQMEMQNHILEKRLNEPCYIEMGPSLMTPPSFRQFSDCRLPSVVWVQPLLGISHANIYSFHPSLYARQPTPCPWGLRPPALMRVEGPLANYNPLPDWGTQRNHLIHRHQPVNPVIWRGGQRRINRCFETTADRLANSLLSMLIHPVQAKVRFLATFK